MNKIELNDDILLNVTRPARYTGREHNIVIKDWDEARIKVCLCYPDTYEIGMSHLGLKILYHILNEREDVLCERSFAPWTDMEKAMLEKKIPLFSLESKMPLASFDIVGFSLQYELTYTNLINMLHLAGIPLKSSDRNDGSSPLIIAGGTCAFNPEPLADFIDIFLIGDGEEGITDIVEAYKKFKVRENSPGRGAERCDERVELLREMAKIEGVYAPSLYDISYSGNRIESISPRYEDIPKKIKKRALKKLTREDFPTKPPVPYISTIHDRIALEIMRGCPNRCRFCQAASIYSPVRIRKSEDILYLAQASYKNTGLDEIALVSLSSACYPGIDKLLDRMTEVFTPLGVGISMPSLRIEEKLKNLPPLINTVRKSGLTFAPEAGTEKMLTVINKGIRQQELFEALKAAYQAGWRRAKLYFMIGLPLEGEDDLKAIVELADKAARLKKEFSRSPAEIVISVSSFIPKPHTPFQWVKMEDAAELKNKQKFLRDMVGGRKYLKLKLHDVDTSILEGVFSRGDRRLGAVLLDAWEKGARFDAWDELFNPGIWNEAFLKNNIEKESYLAERGLDEILPWDHILCGISKEELAADFKLV